MKKLTFLLFLLCFNTFSANIKFNNYLTLDNNFNSKINSFAQDRLGYLWIGSEAGLFRYNAYKFESISSCDHNRLKNILKLYVDSSNHIWISVRGNGLYKYNNGNCIKIETLTNIDNFSIYDFDEDKNQNIWLATNKGIYYIPKGLEKIKPFNKDTFSNNSISSIISYESDTLIFASQGVLYFYDTVINKYEQFSIPNENHSFIHDLIIDDSDTLWIGSDVNLFNFKLASRTFGKSAILSSETRIPSIFIENNSLWVATAGLGLLKVDLNNYSINSYSYNRSDINSIKENTLVSIFLTRENTLWIGGFHRGFSSVNLSNLQFNHETPKCTDNLSFYSGVLDSFGRLWIGGQNEIITFNTKTKECHTIELAHNQPLATIRSMEIIDDELWFLIANNLEVIDIISGKHKKILAIDRDSYPAQLLYDDLNHLIYINSTSKLFKLNLNSLSLETIHYEKNSSIPLQINDIKLVKSEVLVATNKGLLYVDSNSNLAPYENSLIAQEITTIYQTGDSIIVAMPKKGLLILKDEVLQPLLSNETLPDNSKINNIIKVPDAYWLATSQGLIRVGLQAKHTDLFQYNDGTYNSYYYKNFSFLGTDGKLYFGGKNGFISFYPDSITHNKSPPPVVLHNLYSLDKKVKVNMQQPSGLIIDKSINAIEKLNLTHKDYIIGFEFAALDYANPTSNKYAYRLQGFQNDWVYTDATNRRATYTNLSPGDYTFQVKASNKHGIWSKNPKELKITVYPAPWFSPWAYAFYVIIILLAIWSYIRYKTVASRKHAELLEKTVGERTHEVNRQKQMVESLLEHKNEVLANVTHEFRTPLALILGPTEQLTNKVELAQYSQELNMIQRNAERLMLMVAQILKLSEAETNKKIMRESQAVQPILLMLYESFQPLADNKNINITLENNHDVNIYATSECLQVVVGNLLSNAIKYSNNGREISIKSHLLDKQIAISIKDSGSGIETKDIDKIFARFTRLDTHKNIAGTGIGLSVVKEITEANDGRVSVISKWGKGSTFTVTLPTTEIMADEEMPQFMVNQLVSNTKNEISTEQIEAAQKHIKNRATVLIIEDNLDMQTHIGNVLKQRFNCLFANRGRTGIAVALKKLPDIIICDIMMPGMDGYQVARILRHDGRTSHVPIILLTALNTTASRIKGWRENIDMYLTKPFDAKELNTLLDNTLTIRKLLQKQTSKAIHSNGSLSSLDLPKQDLKFIEKFKDVIGEYYGNEYFQKADLAAKMAISERQLHRKLKALIDQSPMDMLRDYRLERATMKLKDGYQVGIVSDECGFGSVSYFGNCFKKKYGVTPKKYQALH